MKILTDKETIELALPALDIGFKLFMIDESASVFDIFHRSSPDILLIKSSSINNAITKNIIERPWMRIGIINDDQDKLNKLKETIGDCFTELEDTPFCNIVTYSKVPFEDLLKSEVVCLEGTETDLSKFNFDDGMSFKIFSSKRMVDHNNFCGILLNNFKAIAIKSSKYCIVNENDYLNAIYCGSTPILDSSLTPAIETTRDEILSGMTNFHRFSEILKKLSLNKESNLVLNKLGEYL